MKIEPDNDIWEMEDFGMEADELNDCFDFDADFDIAESESRFIKPKLTKAILVKWINAISAAKEIEIKPGLCYFGIIHGNFIFGDLLEAILTKKMLQAARVNISTLSLSQDNVDSLRTLIEKNYIKELNLIVSAYFYAHERNVLIKYLHKELDINNKFQLAVIRTHTKIMTVDLGNIKLVIHGSANLRSSANIEQIMIQDSPEIFNFVTEMNNRVLSKYQTINKEKSNKLWQTVQNEKKEPQN
jgi:hypothetical protein